MAALQVTKDTPAQIVNVNRDMDVTVDCTTVGFSVYVRTIRGGVNVSEVKVRFGAAATISFLRNDVAEAVPAGTGTVQVTIL